MRKIFLVAALLAPLAGVAWFQMRRAGSLADGSFLIPTGQRLTPAGAHIEVADRPLGMTLSPDGKLLAVATGSNFAPRALHLIDTQKARAVQTLPVGDSFVGVTFSAPGGELYVGGGRDHDVKMFRRSEDGAFAPEARIQIPGSAPSGLAVTADGRRLFVALNLKHAAAMIDLATREVRELESGSFPYTALAAGGKVYVSNWGGRKPLAGDRTDGAFPVVLDERGIPASGTVTAFDSTSGKRLSDIDVGLHPSAMAFDEKRARLYVANANSDTVSVIDTRTDRVIETIRVGPFDGAPLGSSPNALAVSPGGDTLYVANAANNAVAVIGTGGGRARVEGFIPTGWYPTAVAVDSAGKRLWVASGYGFGSVAPPPAGRAGRSYRDRAGVVSVLDVPGPRELARMTRQVLENNRDQSGQPAPPQSGHPVPMHRGRVSPIRHVFYIIKENRTYDQVLGDLPQGNGDPSLVHFGRDVTPNHHALAEQFVLLDNYYAPGDQSALGHRWCTQGYASDWIHKYGNARNDANPMLFAPSDFLWDNARKHGVSVRAYGERGRTVIDPPNASWTDIYQDWKNRSGKIRLQAIPLVLGLRDIYHPVYPGFNMRITDQLRADIFLEEFRKFEQEGNLPRLVILLLPQNHTNGTAEGFPTPRATVADNDLALGRIVEAVSHSRYWRESAIFVTEDDAQNGLDHVAGHRTVGLVISPWVRRKAVDSTFYTTIHMYRTIEQILGLPPSNQFDLAAEPMFTVFTTQTDLTPYKALPNRIPLDEMNPPVKKLAGMARRLAEASARMDFAEPDAADEQLLNRAVWHSLFPARRYPATRRR